MLLIYAYEDFLLDFFDLKKKGFRCIILVNNNHHHVWVEYV